MIASLPSARPPRAATGYLLILLCALVLWLPGFASLPAIDRDEARFAQATKQMLESGDFVDIRFQGEPRYKKPVGIYWLQAAAVALTGGQEPARIWPYRLPSLLGGLASLLLTVALGERLFNRATGFVAGLLLLATPLLGVEVRMATTDAMLLAASLLAIWSLAGVYRRRDRVRGVSRRWRWGWGEPLLFWAAVSAGILLKGPVILLVVGGTLLGLAITERRWRWLADLRPLPGALLALAIVTPWFLLIARASGDAFFEQSVGRDFLGKLVGVQESHFGPPGYYLLLFCVTFWPSTLLAVLAAPAIWRERRTEAVRFCLAWILPAWIAFELALTKLPHYVLPLYPAIAILAAHGLVEGRLAPGKTGWQVAAAALWIAIGTGIALLGVVVPWSLGAAVDPIAWPVAGLVLVLMAAALVARRKREALLPLLLLALGATPAIYLFGRMLPALDPVWLTREIARSVAANEPCPAPRLAAVGYHEPSLVFTLGTGTALVGLEEAAARLAADPACGLALVPDEAAPAFLELAEASGRRARAVASIRGFNYNKLDVEHLTLFTAD
jgi:4-amino-4-deoxy-L-arabinose transferase-like glycosyltransferase